LLSNVDIIYEIKKKNLAIYPFDEKTIRGSSINLRASSLAWSINKKKSAIEYDANKKKEIIKILPHDTTLIETREILAISLNIAGTFHSRVRITSQGTGHIGTTLNPGWTGQLLIAIHNHTDNLQTIDVGEHFATVMFYYLKTKSTLSDVNKTSRQDVLGLYNIELTSEESKLLDETAEVNDLKSLHNKMSSLDKYAILIKKGDRKKTTIWIIVQIIIIFILITILLLPFTPPELKTVCNIEQPRKLKLES
jgi:deoxycytidine triphosphate deaminase